MDTTPEEAAQVVALLQEGLNQREVARRLNMSQSAVSRVYRRFQETCAFTRRPNTSRRRCTSERDDRFLVSTSLRNRHLTGVNVQQELRQVRGVTVSPHLTLLNLTAIYRREDDEKEFYYDIEKVDKYMFFYNSIVGGRKYLLHEKDEDLPRAKANYKRMMILDKVVQCVFWGYLLWWVLNTAYAQSCLKYLNEILFL